MTATRPQPSERYVELVKRFALAEIQDDEHLEQANTVLRDLLGRPVSPEEQLYVDALSTLIESYETARYGEPSAQPHEFLDLLLCTNELEVDEVALQIGVEPAELAALRQGQRPFSVAIATSLADYFAVDRQAFLGESQREKAD